jgi:AraC family transcriptional regulator of adaptative response/methylated-DNA-[protein]-cysteine methyltransferase
MRELCRYIEAHSDTPLSLSSLGDSFHMSPSHLQRSFKAIVGVSPQKYLEMCRENKLKQALRAGVSISQASFEAGLNSSSQLYGKALGMTPKTYQQGGEAVPMRFAIRSCAIGFVLVAASDKGICAVTLGDTVEGLERALKEEFHQADIAPDDGQLEAWIEAILEHLAGSQPHLDLPLDVQATAFQQQVWQVLKTIPYGQTRSYAEVAAQLGRPEASRAVASACASNPTALIVPCHRVVRSDGSVSGYRWGVERKAWLLEQEQHMAAALFKSDAVV